ncbi:ParB/RepB/Spo0J family partition protein [Nocardia abscessus]|uniref:ParB/RepB/Spo0J family partition protein n=1 Tax=Nocardia abscessus TaxID=120957 RepID=UPI001893C016|nr:ParB/RepB/Spo0J family partition protein [Nocardia abscessus]MBF6339807.1 ParB/RepB/Spo0J family partition protein [Nocardia abscessus]
MTTSTLTAVADPATDPGPDTDPVAVEETVPAAQPAPAVEESIMVEEPVVLDVPEAKAEYLDPAELVIAENVRKSFDLAAHPEEAASIREFGVGNPIRAEREADGSVHVVDGQIRTLIAREVGLTRVPVWVTDAPTDIDPKERRIARTLTQINLNDRRIPLTDADRATGIALMLDLGASATRVAKGLQRKRSEIQKTAAVGASDTAKRLLEERQYGLDQLAVIAHYENLGDTDAVQRLATAGRWSFASTAKRIEHDRAETRARLHESLLYGAYGFGVLASEPDTSEPDAAYIPASELVTAAGEPVSEELIYADPARWVVFVEVQENGLLVDKDTGAIIDAGTVDWSTRGDLSAEPADGQVHAEQVQWRDRWIPSYFLPTNALADSGLQQIVPDTGDGSEEAAAKAAADREQARQDRRRVIELNKRGDAANARRQEFLPRLLAGRTPPRQAAAFVAESMAHTLDPTVLQKVTKLLGVGGSTQQLVAAIHAATPSQAWMIVLAMQIAAAEAPIGKSFWRDSSAATKRYLHFLAEAAAGTELDFALVDVEQAAAGDIDYHDIDLAS